VLKQNRLYLQKTNIMNDLITKTAEEIQEQCNAGASVSDVISLLDDFKKQLNLGVVVKSFYCNQDDGEYNNNPCAEQCRFCKEVEALQ